MATQKGIFPLTGTVGGMNFYYLNGKPIARKAGGGFNGKAIQTKASMQRVRENGSEFGHCSQVNKAFRTALRPFYAGHRFTYFHSRLMGLFTGIKDLDTVNKRGKRTVAEGMGTPEGSLKLQQFTYTPQCDIPRVFPFVFDYDMAAHSLQIPNFTIDEVAFVPGATHIQLTFGVLCFDFESLTSQLFLATPQVLPKNYTGTSLSFTSTVPGITPGIPIGIFGVRFFQEVNGVLYLLDGKDSVGIGVIGS